MSDSVPKTILCLGNPGTQYSRTRHNVGWWFADRLADRYDLGRFRKQGLAGVARGRIEGVPTQVLKPFTFMNLAGRAIAGIQKGKGFELDRDFLVVVDDVALEPGRARFRPGGSAGGHNGLKSVQAALGTTDYARLRIGVGSPPAEWDLADWVLSAPSRDDRDLILDRLGPLVDCVGVWAVDGVEVAMNHCNN